MQEGSGLCEACVKIVFFVSRLMAALQKSEQVVMMYHG
jgi:hypothetical protein